MDRSTIYTQRFRPYEVEGHLFIIPVFEDLDDSELIQQLVHFMEVEDYEYCEHISAEAASRNLDISHHVKQFFT